MNSWRRRWKTTTFLVLGTLCLLANLAPCCHALQQEEAPTPEVRGNVEQELKSFDVRVSDADGNPVANATVTPWAIRSASGHGIWSENRDDGVKPQSVTTDATGKATVQYPLYSEVQEQLRVTGISFSIDHPDHPYLTDGYADVPADALTEVSLPQGTAVEAVVTLDGKPAESTNIHLMSNSGRPSSNSFSKNEKGIFRVAPIAKGTGQLMFVQLDADKNITHFSPIDKFEVDGTSEIIKRRIELQPARSVRGRLCDSVPRPVKNGLVKVMSIGTGEWSDLVWSDWAKVDEQGTFEIEAWPNSLPMQLIAICDGFAASKGEKPEMVSPGNARGNYMRAQVFLEPWKDELVVEMTAMSKCTIQVENAFGKKLKDVQAFTNPNVGWWNGGAQIYCWPLNTTKEYLLTGKFDLEAKKDGPQQPFSAMSDENGVIELELPAGAFQLWLADDRFQLPAVLGRRYKRIDVTQGEPVNLKVVLQPKGLDVLGDWEDLCGLVFG